MITDKLNQMLKDSENTSEDYAISAYMLEHLTEIPGTTVDEILNTCHVTKEDLESFVRKLGYSSFQALREDAGNYAKSCSIEYELFADNVSLAENIENVTEKKLENIRYCTDHLGQDVMRELGDRIVNSSRIFVFAQGSTRPMAHLLRTELIHSGKDVLITDQYLKEDYHPKKNDLFIFISLIGQSFKINPSLMERIEKLHADKWLITCNQAIEFSGRRWVIPVKDQAYSQFAVQHAIDLLTALVEKSND